MADKDADKDWVHSVDPEAINKFAAIGVASEINSVVSALIEAAKNGEGIVLDSRSVIMLSQLLWGWAQMLTVFNNQLWELQHGER